MKKKKKKSIPSISNKKSFLTFLAAALLISVAAALFIHRDNLQYNKDGSETASYQPTENVSEEATVNDEYGFKINAPKDWTTTKEPVGSIIQFFDNQEIDEDTAFTANVSVTAEETDLNEDQYFEVIKNLHEQTPPNYELIDITEIEVNGKKALLIEGTRKIDSLELHEQRISVLHDKKTYAVIGTTLHTEWDSKKDKIYDSLVSLRFTD